MKVKIKYTDWRMGGERREIDTSWTDMVSAYVDEQRGIEGSLIAMKKMLGGILEVLVEKKVVTSYEDVVTVLGTHSLPDDFEIEE